MARVRIFDLASFIVLCKLSLFFSMQSTNDNQCSMPSTILLCFFFGGQGIKVEPIFFFVLEVKGLKLKLSFLWRCSAVLLHHP